MVVSWRVSVPFCTRYGRQLAYVCAILHQVWSLVGVGLCHLHQVWSSTGVFVACIRYGQQLALCHFASGMVVSWHVCAVGASAMFR